MLILALDTTTRAGSVAVTHEHRVLAVIHGDASRTHGERLPGEIQRALSDAGVRRQDVEWLAVATGPGAFTGLRIGLAAVQGMAMVLNVPVIGVSALDALAHAGGNAGEPRGTITAWMDAQRGEVFSATYDLSRSIDAGWVPRDVPMVSPPDAALAAATETGPRLFIGDGAVRYRDLILSKGGDGVRVLEPPDALAPHLAALARHRVAHGEGGPPHTLQPLYVRRPDAELERQRRAQ